MAKKGLVTISARVPARLKRLIKKYVQQGLHANVSDFARDALREKLARDVPELYRRLIGDAPE